MSVIENYQDWLNDKYKSIERMCQSYDFDINDLPSSLIQYAITQNYYPVIFDYITRGIAFAINNQYGWINKKHKENSLMVISTDEQMMFDL